MSDVGHWTSVYVNKAADDVSWYQATPGPSLAALDRLGVTPSAAFIDVGGGASNLVDELIERGWSDLTVLDIASSALEVSKARLGARSGHVDWIAADVTAWRPARQFDVWHDRAVFHFLTENSDRRAYRAALLAGLKPGGTLIMATFAPDGPDKCSGLPVQRHDPESLSNEIGPGFELVESWREEHVTPWGSQQRFNWCIFRRNESR